MDIGTDRLILRRWRDSDREPFAAMNADPEVMRYFRGTLTRDESDSFIDRIEAGFGRDGLGLWAVEIADRGEFIGFTGLVWQRYEAHFTPAVEVGWRLAQSAWGNGYATEAAKEALRFGFANHDLDEIVSVTTLTNERSRAVMRRLGMTYDPADDFDYPSYPHGHPLGRSVVYRLRREDWLAR